VESGVKDGYLRNAGAHNVAGGSYAFQVCRVVKGRQLDAVLDAPGDRLVDDNRLCEFLGAMHHPVTDGMDVGERVNAGNLRLGRNNPPNHVVECRAMIAQRDGRFQRRPAGRLEVDQRLTADALNEALGLLHIRIFFDDIEVCFNDLEFE
jgi:hypothetical protein